MIITKTFQAAKLDAITKLVEEDVKEVRIFFDERISSWCVEWEIFTEEDL